MVNGIVGLLATGGSTNHSIHWWCNARAAGILIDWDDFDCLAGYAAAGAGLSERSADVNHFHAAGGVAS